MNDETILPESPKVREAFRRILLDHTWLASLILGLELEAYEGPKNPLSTASVDGKKLRYSPTWMESLSDAQVTTVLGHEVLHAGLLHLLPARLATRDAIAISPAGPIRLSNIAQDYVVNDILLQAGFAPLTGNWLHDEKYRGMPWEQVYDLLLSEIPEGNKVKMAGFDFHGEMSGDGEDGQTEKLAEHWKRAMADALTLGKMQGKLTDDMEKALSGVFKARVPWELLLADLVSRMLGKTDYTYRKPSRRGRALDLYLPSTYSEQIESLVFCWDTSGSMFNEDDLKTSIGNTMSALQQFNVGRAVLIQGDTEIKAVTDLGSADDVPTVLKGGGGTDFRPLLAKAAEYNPEIVIFFSDLYGEFGDDPGLKRLLWVTRSKDVQPKFGEVFLVED